MRLGVVLFNLGGPDRPGAVKPFLFNLFNDPAIISAPQPIRYCLAKFISSRREKIAQANYDLLGGGSPIVPNTQAQLEALKTRLGNGTALSIAMRYWHPRADMAAEMMRKAQLDRIVLLPLYPQFSTTTTGSSVAEWYRVAPDLKKISSAICCYPTESGFIDAMADLTRQKLMEVPASLRPILLFSAHGLPKKIVDKGDPYPVQVEATVSAVVTKLGLNQSNYRLCYQSRVGPLEWIGPSTDDCIRDAGKEGRAVIVVPVAFVSEHSETLVELDIEYRHLAEKSGVPRYERVPTVSTHPSFIDGLARLVEAAATSNLHAQCGVAEKFCPAAMTRCFLTTEKRCGFL